MPPAPKRPTKPYTESLEPLPLFHGVLGVEWPLAPPFVVGTQVGGFLWASRADSLLGYGLHTTVDWSAVPQVRLNSHGTPGKTGIVDYVFEFAAGPSMDFLTGNAEVFADETTDIAWGVHLGAALGLDAFSRDVTEAFSARAGVSHHRFTHRFSYRDSAGQLYDDHVAYRATMVFVRFGFAIPFGRF